jgi:hypothetical protein
MAPKAARDAAAASQAGGSEAASQDGQVTAQARRALQHCKGRTRIKVDDLGPAVFNRLGAATSGKHCHKLGATIIKEQGFATYRYEAGYCHEPDPADPLAVSRHGNSMAKNDPLLPNLPNKPLYGVFAKTHLVTFLQLYRDGRMPELTRWVAASKDQDALAELHDVLDHGIYMQVFPWRVVQEHRADLEALMASDNFDHAFGLTDSELRCVKNVRDALSTLTVPVGMSKSQTAIAHLRKMSGPRWNDKDCDALVEFAQTTCDEQLDFLLRAWNYAELEAEVKVEASFYLGISKLPAKLQWSRAAIALRHFMSDTEKGETLQVSGKTVAAAVSKQQLLKLNHQGRSEEQKAASQAGEDFIVDVINKYYKPWASDADSAPYLPGQLTKGISRFLVFCGRHLLAEKPWNRDEKARLEEVLRKVLCKDATGPLPPPCVAVSQGTQHNPPPPETDTIVADSAGVPIVSMKRQAFEAGLDVESEVLLRSDTGGAIGKVRRIAENGIHVSWDGAAPRLEKLSELRKRPEDKKTEKGKAASQALEIVGAKWAACSTEWNNEMLCQQATVALYTLYVTRSAGHGDIHVLGTELEGAQDFCREGQGGVFAAKDFKEGQLALLPFDTKALSKDKVAKGVPVQLLVEPNGEAVTTISFWIRQKNIPKKLHAGQEKAVVVVPFWVLAAGQAKAAHAKEEEKFDVEVGLLSYKVGKVQLPSPGGFDKVAKGGSKVKIFLRFPYLTNSQPLRKGARLETEEDPPTDLDTLHIDDAT